MLKKWILTIMCLSMLCVSAMAGEPKDELSFLLMTNRSTNLLEGRAEWTFNEEWAAGVLGTYYENAEEPDENWGFGLFAKLAVDPNATIPLAEWFPKIGAWIKLPESLSISTYIIGKGELIPCTKDKGIDIVASIGAGGEIGPVVVEWLYAFVESGNADNPMMTSGPVLFFGIKPIKF